MLDLGRQKMSFQDGYFTGVLTALGGILLGWWVDRYLTTIAAADEPPPRNKW
jgi:hypothetical protein